jgi:hypothetical protein
MSRPRFLVLTAVAGALASGGAALTVAQASPTTTHVPVRITGGHTTDSRDAGRPVVLVAAGLGVPTEVFRRAFSQVSPAAAGEEPDPDQVQRNKAALLKVLAPYGVTNEDLDRVSDFYRYNGTTGGMWTHSAAKATATVRDGRVVSVRVVSGGAGYSSPPTLKVPGTATPLKASVVYGKTLSTNGRIGTVTIG